MYIFKNALKSITRTKARNILIGIIIIVIAIASCVALSIKDAANELTNNYKETYDVTAELTLDRGEMKLDAKNGMGEPTNFNPQDFMSNIPEITAEMIEKYGDSIYVKSYEYSGQISLNGENLEKVTMQTKGNNMTAEIVGRIDFNGKGSMSSGDFSLIGYNSLEAIKEFLSGSYKITEGEMFDINSKERVAVITDELAEKNNLSVGDMITLKNPNNEDEVYEFKVVGIYTDSSANSEFSMFSRAANQIITNYSSVKDIVENSKSNEDSKLTMQLASKFNLTSADVIDNFKEELTNKGLNSYYTLQTNIDSFNEAVAPLENLSKFAIVFLIIVLIVGGSILVIINMLNIRERKYEIGVLRAIGMKKHKVLGQFLIELLIVTMTGIIIGTVIGSFLTVPTASTMLKSQIESLQDKQNSVN